MPDATEALGNLPRARNTSLVEQVHAEIKERILDGRLPPGALIPDSVVAKQMGVSRAPVREAMGLLAQSGLLTKIPNYPYRVREAGNGLPELQLLRWGYELAAARHIVMNTLSVDAMEPPIADMTSAYQKSDTALSGQADLAFHRAMILATGLPLLISHYEEISAQLEFVMRDLPAFVMKSQAYRHRELLTVLRDCQEIRDPTRILRLLDTHLLTVRADVTAADEAELDSEI